MKKQLKAIYDSIIQESVTTPVKVEPTYEVKGYSWYGKDGYYNRGKVLVVLLVVEEEVDLTEEVSKIQIGEIHLMIQEKQIR